MSLAFQLELADRASDRVHVAVSIVPSDEPAEIDGIAVQVVSRQGEALSPRLLLPVAGRLAGALMTTAELRSLTGELPLGAKVVGTAWGPGLALEATCPADSWTELAAHVRGHPAAGMVTRDVPLEPLVGEARDALLQRLTWLGDCPWCAPDEPLEAISAEDERQKTEEEEALDEMVDDLGLDDDCAEWLRDLLHEED